MDMLRRAFAFRTTPTTILVVVCYVAIIISVLVTDELPSVPKNQNGLDLQEAYRDLHEIASRPHPYNSHANDLVREYILDRVNDIALGHAHVKVVDDQNSTACFGASAFSLSGTYAAYFEGNNILVKIAGTEPDAGEAVLFSAHFDSVSTAPGATDDGMGVATLIQLVKYLAENPQRRTAIFNINNAEEDGLYGASAFMEHPWSNLTDVFLNLEGASSGGRPLLFRATSAASTLSFQNVPHPHGNVLSADAFARGAIRSGTDYSVYTPRMQGLDLAFYRGRSKYHTKYDAVPFTSGGDKALWAMMEAAQGAGLALLNNDATHAKNSAPGVYFDLFAAAMVVFPLNTLWIFNIVFVTVGPIVLILLLACETVIKRKRAFSQNGDVPEIQPGVFQQLWIWFKKFEWLRGFWLWAKFWVALAVAIGFQALLIWGYTALNPYIAYSYPYLVLLSSSSLAYITFFLVVNLPIFVSKYQVILPELQKNVILLQTYIFTWFLLVVSTVLIGKIGIGGVYFISIWNVVVFAACCIGTFTEMLNAKSTVMTVGQHLYVEGERLQEVPEGEGEGEDPTETTPLIIRNVPPPAMMLREEETGAIGWWILQTILVVPVPVILISHIAVMLIGAMAQTLSDGGTPVSVYVLISLLAVLLVVPVAPFTFKMSNRLAYFIGAVFIVITAYTWLEQPFSSEAPLKVYFVQRLTLNRKSGTVEHAETSISGVTTFLESQVLPFIPSTLGKHVSCSADDSVRQAGLTTCAWNSMDMLPSPGQGNRWMNINVTRSGDEKKAKITVKGFNTRDCRVYFDSPIKSFVVGGSRGVSGNFLEVRMKKRYWDEEFVLDVNWEREGVLSGRVACMWTEYQSGSVGAGSGGSIPAIEEILTWLPSWAVVTKRVDGLVEVLSGFRV